MKVRRFVSGVAIATAALLSTAGIAGAQSTATTTTTGSAGSTGSTTPSTVDQLFVQTATGGALKPVAGKPGVYTLALQGVAADLTSFTDRPLRVRSGITTADFVDLWNGGTFEASPPNAALVIDDAPTSRDTFVFTLTDPRYDAKSKQVTYTATIVTDALTGRLADLADAIDQNPPKKFGRASLFVDSLPTTSMTVTISNLDPGEQASYDVDGWVDLQSVEVLQGTVRQVIATMVVAGDPLTPNPPWATTTAVLVLGFCVDPGQTTAAVTTHVDNNATATFTFDLGTGPQTFTNVTSGTLNVPARYQLQGCGPT